MFSPRAQFGGFPPGGSNNSVQYNNGGVFGGFGSYSSSTTTLTMTDHILMRDNFQVLFGTSNDSLIAWNTAQTVDALFIGTATGQNTVVMAEILDYTFDFAHAAQTNPTFFIHSANQSTTEWISFTHNGTDGLIDVGTGVLSIPDSVSIVPATDRNGLLIKEFAAGTSFFDFQVKDSADVTWWYVRKRVISDTNAGMGVDFQTSGTNSIRRVGFAMTAAAGFTGAEFTTLLSFDSTIAGTATYYTADSTTFGYRPSGNRGIGGFSRATTVGHNTGCMAGAGGGAYNYGAWFMATANKTSARNIGVFATGLNQGAGTPVSIGGYFTLLNISTAPPVDTTCALIADNGTASAPVFIGRDNGTPVFSLENDGEIVHGNRAATNSLGYKFLAIQSVQTTDATVTTIQTIPIATSTCAQVTFTVTGIRSDNAAAGAYKKTAAYKNNAGTVTLIGTVTTITVVEDDAAWDADIAISGTNVIIRVTGVAATTIRWQCSAETNAIKT